jgi:hypothetical protein
MLTIQQGLRIVFFSFFYFMLKLFKYKPMLNLKGIRAIARIPFIIVFNYLVTFNLFTTEPSTVLIVTL